MYIILITRHPNKHQLRTDATRRKLLKSARRIFAREGFEAARIEDIAANAGHTRGAFYAQFNSKEELFFALLEQEVKEHAQRIEALLECCTNAEERLEALRDYYVARAADLQWVMLMLEFKLFALRHPRLKARLVEVHRRIRSLLNVDAIRRLLPERVHLDPELIELRRVALEGTLNGLALEHAYDPKRISEDQLGSILRQTFNLLMRPE